MRWLGGKGKAAYPVPAASLHDVGFRRIAFLKKMISNTPLHGLDSVGNSILHHCTMVAKEVFNLFTYISIRERLGGWDYK